MTTRIGTIDGNAGPSEKLKGMLIDLRDTTRISFNNIEERMEKIRTQAHSEGFSEPETIALVKQYLKEFLTDNQIRWITYEKPRRLEAKKLREKLATSGTDANMPITESESATETVSISTDYKVVVPDQVLEEETKQFKQEQEDTKPVNEVFEELEPNHGVEELRAELEDTKRQLAQEREDRRQAEEKIDQLEAGGVSPTNNFPALQGNILRTRIVVNPLFREVIGLKGSKAIYANIIIDMSQNKYVRLEPVYSQLF